ncbi:MAG: hypothetical protein WB588_01360 [Dehalococcoidia bacterium]
MANKIVRCNYCNATGKVGSGYGSHATTMCPVCFGRGQISIDSDAVKCSGCNGTGRQYTGYFTSGPVKHNACHGMGWITPDKGQAACPVMSTNKMMGNAQYNDAPNMRFHHITTN